MRETKMNWTQYDDYLMHEGTHSQLFEKLGVHVTGNQLTCSVYAPNCDQVFMIGDFNAWLETTKMSKSEFGIWTVKIDLQETLHYKFRIYTNDTYVDKCDPFSFVSNHGVNCESIFFNIKELKNNYKIPPQNINTPINIYELHLGGFDQTTNYVDIAKSVIKHVKKMNYTHVEIMPIYEYPSDSSWGYQVTGFYSITNRYGSILEFKKMIQLFHKASIKVILDWVGVHFANDHYSLNKFDSTSLFESEIESSAQNYEWGTINFDHSSGFVRSFLMSNLNYLVKYLQVDGFRFDAVSHLIYNQGIDCNDLNEAGIKFLKTTNGFLKDLYPNLLLIAEDSSSYPNVTKKVSDGGLGFDLKWNLGWMHDNFKFFKAIDKRQMWGDLTFSFHYMKNEHYLLPISHDEVVHLKQSVVNKFSNDYFDKFLIIKQLYTHMIFHPGKKLNFMGNDIAINYEFNEQATLDWDILKQPINRDFNDYMLALNKFYSQTKALQIDSNLDDSFSFVSEHIDKQILIYKRSYLNQSYYVVFNFSHDTHFFNELKFDISGKLKYLFGNTTELIDLDVVNHHVYTDIPRLSVSVYLHTADLNLMRLTDLKQLCKKYQLRKYSTLKKSYLIEKITKEVYDV